jgi:hypothetical protein
MKAETLRRRRIKAAFMATDVYTQPGRVRKGIELAWRLVMNRGGTHVARVEQLTPEEMELRFKAREKKPGKTA